MGEAGAAAAGRSLARHLMAVLADLEPALLGLYWPHRSEFNAPALLATSQELPFPWPVALPFAQRAPVQMHYRAWDGQPPRAVDDCGIPASDGAKVQPDVVLVPCVAFTREGLRLGYGGGFFDRWMAQHPDVTTIGIAWSGNAIDAAALQPEPHDLPLTLIVTEQGVV